MGRPEPCVLFSQTFLHPQLDEYVDEVLFNESIVITACEFIEQNASSASSVVTLVGATSPPSFALEVFVQCEGEPRFRRLCQPFLYSHSSSNMLEVEAVVTNHLVVRGSYRSLTLVVYGNTAEDLGQFNIEFDLDSSLANLVCSPSEGKLEDLPPALHSTKLTLEESIFSPKLLSLLVGEPDVSFVMEQFLQLIIRFFEASGNGDAIHTVVSTAISAVSSYVTSDLRCTAITWNQCKRADSTPCREELWSIFTEAKNELEEVYRTLQHEASCLPAELFGEGNAIKLETQLDTAPFELLADVFSWYHLFITNSPDNGKSLSKNKSMILGLSVVLLLCSGKETCFHFVSGGGMEQLVRVFHHETQKSTAVTLMLLGVVERATRYATGCEGFLGWWPREDEIVPVGSSGGYSQILKLLLQKQRHGVASLAAYLLHRLRFYEVASRYESAVLSLLAGLSDADKVANVNPDLLDSAKLQLKKLLKLLNSSGPIEDPSPVASSSRSLVLGQSEGVLSYRATINLITSSNCCFSNFNVDPHLLSLLKERGFLPLTAALLSSSVLRSEKGHTLDMFMDIASVVEAIILSLLFCRSGLVFLLLRPEIAATLVHSLKGTDDINKEECAPLRYASVLINKGFFCSPQDVGMITELHLRVVNAIDRLLSSSPQSEELLWVLWELCGLSRSDSGRQALFALRHFPEAVSVLMEALRSAKDVEPVTSISGASPLSLAIFHSAADLFEVIVADSTASSLGSWIEHSVELHKALHSSSPGSNRKDAPTRLLEWIDAGVVYRKNGAIGLLRYAAVLASGGDAHLTSASILVSDSVDVENVVGDFASGSDIQVVENLLGKLVSDKYFEGVTLRDSSIAQLTTTFRILAFISGNSLVAGALYDEGAVTLIYVVIVNCKSMLERSSNTYDYLVDEGTEGNSMSDMLLERSREQSLVDLMIPALLLLNTLLHKLQEAEQHRNTKLLNALLQLHREVSPKLAACSADLSSPYPGSALGLGAVCHLLVSSLACWPVFGWTPNLFDCLLDSDKATSSLDLGPKEACSLLCLLGDLFPEEGIWLWKNGMPSLSAFRSLAIATLFGPQTERQVNWYLKPQHVATSLSRITPLLDKIAQIILHFASTALVVIQDMLRLFIVRIACQQPESAAILLHPIILWMKDHVSETYSPSDTDVFKVYRLLDFLASLLEHPCGKALLLKAGVIGILNKSLKRCSTSFGSEGKIITESKTQSGTLTPCNWCLPLVKSITLICGSQLSAQTVAVSDISEKLSVKDCSFILHHLLKLCQVLPVGKQLLASLIAFKEIASCSEGRSAFASIPTNSRSSTLDESELEKGQEHDGDDGLVENFDWSRCPPLLHCWRNIFRSINSRERLPTYAVEAIWAMSSSALSFCLEGKSLHLERVAVLKYLFGLPLDSNDTEPYSGESLKDFSDLIGLLDAGVIDPEHLSTSDTQITSSQVKGMAKLLLLILQKPTSSIKVDDIIGNEGFISSSTIVLDHSTCTSKTDDIFTLDGLAEKFLWDCPDSLRESSLSSKRKISSTELPPNRRPRVDSSVSDPTRVGLNGPVLSSTLTRRDNFRQRKPNTSRPPSMHVDDYVARERNIDGGSSGSNIITSIQRGVTGGRPPSIHVDEFMARQRERQGSMSTVVGEVAPQTPSTRDPPPENEVDRSRQLKADLDDDLQEINIVFDDEESESDDKLPFPQMDENLQPAPVVTEPNSPRSIVEETESDANGSTHVSNTTIIDETSQDEFSSRRARPEKTLSRETSISSERKPLNNFSGFPPQFSNFYYNQKPPPQPPLPPMPPPPNVSCVQMQPPLPPGFPSQASMSMYTSWGGSGSSSSTTRPPPPPLPPTPPPPATMKTSSTSQSPASLTSYSPPQMVAPPLLGTRPASIPVSLFSSPTIISVQPRPQLQPLQPPQPTHPHPQQLQSSPPIQVPFQLHQQSHISPIHVYYPPQQQQQPQPVELTQSQSQSQSQAQPQQGGDNGTQLDSEMSLQQYFSSPEAIQSLLSDRDKLCDLLEKNPKLMQMLQDRLGQ